MERRNWSLEALKEIKYISTLSSKQRSYSLIEWCNTYLINNDIQDFDLPNTELKELSEYFFRNLEFMKKLKDETQVELLENRKIRKYMLNT